MHDLICGKLLGDGCLTKQQGRKPRFQFTHCKKDIGWSIFCYEQLAGFLPLNSPKYRRINDSRVASGFTESYIVQSRTSDEINKLYELWYPNSKKALPFEYIEKHFNEKTLAWWYQDDGHFKQQNCLPKKIILSTDSFSINENKFLIKLLQIRFGLLFSSDAQNRLVLYDQFQIIFFLNIVEPHIHETMNRKKWIQCEPKKIANRTTIYLPSEYTLLKPTTEINEQYKKLPQLSSLAKNHLEFFMFVRLVQSSSLTTKPYQIKINDKSKEVLEQLKRQTGLNISQLTELAFKLSQELNESNNKKRP